MSASADAAPAPLWVPSPERVRDAQLTAFRRQAEAVAGRALPDYDALWAWSVEAPPAFWTLVWDFTGVVGPRGDVALRDGGRMPGASWFPGSSLNFAENLLRHRGGAPALIAFDEREGPPVRLTRDQLRAEVAGLAAWMEAQGVGEGDVVAVWLANRVEAVITMLAAASLGAAYTSSSPDFGPGAVLDRFQQVAPKLLVVGDGSRYAGKTHDLTDKAAAVAEALAPSLAAVLVVPVVGHAARPGALANATDWPPSWANASAPEPTFRRGAFDRPLYVLYSSGTTGVPKCIVHGQGGTLLQHAKEHALHTDVREGDVLFYFTTTGWMMWNWLVSGLFTGATVVLYDGSPAHPDAGVLWRMAERARVTAFGASPKFLAVCHDAGVRPIATHDLSALRTIMSTGSPLSPDQFRQVYEDIKADVQLASISGGTDIVSCFMLGSPIDPVYAGEIQKRGLGMAVEAWAGPGRPVESEKAELVCTRPFPSMPVGFVGDPDGSRYHKAYFAVFPGVWRHGDYVEITPRSGVIVYGRSDATLNPGGVRIGTAEIYRPVEASPEVSDALVVGLPHDDDVEVVLFVVPAPGHALDAALVHTLRRRIREAASPRHVPARVLEAPGVPRTISGKKVELAVASVLQGEPAPNRDALANPEVLDWFATEGRAALEASRRGA
jgi:acetoacetyl-CoA synthetase